MRFIALLFIYLKLIRNTNGANILLIGALASPSHYMWNKVLLTELVRNGHNVTVITHDYDSTKMENYTVITMKGFYQHLAKEIPAKEMFQTNVFQYIHQAVNYGAIACTFDFGTEGFKELMDYPPNFTFDLIIYDITNLVCLYGLIPRFNNPPVIGVTAFLVKPYLSYTFGNPLQTSHIPHYCSKFTNQMNLRERLTNTIYSWADILMYKYISIPRQTAITRAVFGEDMIPRSLYEIERNISLLLVNTDPVFDHPMALAPNIIPVGGLHTKPAKSLPQDFEAIYNKSNDGVIVFSLGTNVRSDILNKSHTDAFLKVFSTLKQAVIWKFETGELENVPQNVFIKKWLPQNDLIGHSNTKLFITHFGGLGTQEAMYHGVPMVGFPVYVDQHINAAKLADKKIALYLDYESLTYENIYNAITEVLNNPMYKENVVKLSQRYKNQPLTALERAVFWIEQVLRDGDVHYLNLPTRDMPMYQALNFDVIILITICLVFIYAVLKSVVMCYLYVLRIFKQDKVKEKVM